MKPSIDTTPLSAAEENLPGEAEADLGLEAGEAVEHEQREAAVSTEWHGERLDKVLVRLAPEFSRSHLQQLIEGGHVRLAGQVASSASRKVSAGQWLQLTLVPTAQSTAFRAEPVPLDIVYEDEALLVVNKPAGLVVHPAAGNWSGTLLNGLLAHHSAAAGLARAGIVHRLDKDTSGLMVVAKTLPAQTALTRAIAAREVSRRYLALALGEVPLTLRSVEAPIGRDPISRVRMAVVEGGKWARTDIERLALWGQGRAGVSALRCVLHTGRTHQIRVHLASQGHALVADALYGGRPLLGLQRQALHASRLALRHPLSGQDMAWYVPLPADLAVAWEAVGAPLDA
jgi:23S rRNA pseudouridine1911/1915/1917 synthase